jgi:hypothetical protein
LAKTWQTLSPDEQALQKTSLIEERELEAIAFCAGIEMATPDKSQLLAKYYHHQNSSVRYVSVYNSVRLDYGPLGESLYDAIQEWDTEQLGKLVDCLPRVGLNESWLVAARVAMNKVLESSSAGHLTDKQERSLTLPPTRILARSKVLEDQLLLRSAAMLMPNQPILWVAAARSNQDEELLNVASKVYNDASKPTSLRASAGLVVAEHTPEVYAQVKEWLIAYFNQYASSHTPSGGASKDHGMLAVLRDLPDEQLESLWSMMPTWQYNYAGQGALAVFAKRDPKRFVEMVLASPSTSGNKSVAAPLALAIKLDPTLTQYAVTQYPEEHLTPEIEFLQQYGVIGTPAIGEMLWD